MLNCAAADVPSPYAKYKICYLNYSWPQRRAFDLDPALVDEVYSFLEGAFESHESVLIHSLNGKGRACIAAALYFMKKYAWALLKTLEFLSAKKPSLELSPSMIKKFLGLEKKLVLSEHRLAKPDWKTGALNGDELTIVNTYLNSKAA